MCAKMFPSEINERNDNDKEYVVFDALKNYLDDNYRVYHSKKTIKVDDDTLRENEADFIIYNRQKGILILEVKNSRFRYDGEQQAWVFDSRNMINPITFKPQKMPHNGPWEQAQNEQKIFINHLKKSNAAYIYNQHKCKILYAVCILNRYSQNQKNTWPASADPNLTIFANDLLYKDKLQKKIDAIFSININEYRNETNLTTDDEKILLDSVLEPYFQFGDDSAYDDLIADSQIRKFKEDQIRILDFTENVKSVAISGAAGTGKTVVALEKARRLSKNGEQVLFLCFNNEIVKHLSTTYSSIMPNVIFKTIAGFVKNDLGDRVHVDYDKASSTLTDIIQNPENNRLTYKHVIIDEGQDFSINEINNNEILYWLYDAMKVINPESCFYIFYDEYQRVNGNQNKELPDFIKSAKSILNLSTNCRNTTNIARASLKPIKIWYANKQLNEKQEEITKQFKSLPELEQNNYQTQQKYKSLINNKKVILKKIALEELNSIKGFTGGEIPNMYFLQNNTQDTIRRSVNSIINNYLNEPNHQSSDITILTCESEQQSIFKNEIQNRIWNYRNIRFMSTNTFKGLESEFIILIKVDKNTFTEYPMSYYVGTSRAKRKLAILTCLTDSDCHYLITNWLHEKIDDKIDTQNQFASSLKCIKSAINN